MSKILFAWELGAGLGHLVPARGIFEKLCSKGHSLTLVLRDLSRAKKVFGGLKLALLQAPVKTNLPNNAINITVNYSHILNNVGYEQPDELEGLIGAWCRLYELERPELVIADHSPTAMLAARCLNIKTVAIGCGFLIPPDTYPFPNMRLWEPFDQAQAKRADDRVIKCINEVLRRLGQQPLARIGQIFSEAEDCMLTTYPELDHYPERNGGTYWGSRGVITGRDFDWPAGRGPKLFCYLRPCDNFNAILQTLKDLKHPTIVSSADIPIETQKQFATPEMRFEPDLLDLDKVFRECSLAIINGNHELSSRFVLAGVPLLCVPTDLDKWMFSIVVQRLGAGLMANPAQPGEFAAKLANMLSSTSYSERARQFAARYAENDLQKMEEMFVARLEEILAPGWKRHPAASPLKVTGAPLLKSAAQEAPSQKPEEKAYSVSMVQRSEVASKPAQVAMPAGSNKLLDQALDYHRSGRIEEASQIYASLLQEKPDNPIVLHLMGVVRLQLRDFQKAVELISRAVQLHPSESSYYNNLGEAYRNMGQYERATECFLIALRLKPDYPEACNNLALSLQAQGKHAAALARFQEAIKYNPRYVMAHNNLGRLYGELGQLEQSRACFEQARRAAQNP